MRAQHQPTATYRLQVGVDLGFSAVSALVDYLHQLGISDVYLSPIQAPRQGSTHGYDIVDHSRLNPALGSEDELRALGARLRERQMGLIADVVPNHMCVADQGNRWWADVLENGPSSPASRFFDIDWNPPKPDLVAKVLLPVLGEQYGRVLESGNIRIAYGGGAFFARVYDMEFPVAPRTWTALLEPALDDARIALGEDSEAVQELESVLVALGHLPPRTETDPVRVRERQREKEIIKRRLLTLVESTPLVNAAIEAQVARINGTPGAPRSFDGLEALLADQAYRLSFWRVASDEINYRRFFDVNELAAILVEEPRVFAAVHGVLLGLISDGTLTGLRVDHVDGLSSPEHYLHDLARACHAALHTGEPTPDPPAPAAGPPVYVMIEKILLGAEELPASWPVNGTTGYDFLNALNGVFVDIEGAAALKTGYRAFTGSARSFADVAYACKKLILRVSLSSELTMLTRRLDRVSEQQRYSRDFTLNGLQEGLAEAIACFPVYRTYIREGDSESTIGAADRATLAAAIREAKRRNPAVSRSIFDFIASVLLLSEPEGLLEADQAERRELVLAFQQLTAPVMAKGVEDTAFYRYLPLASLNEVGGDPGRAGIPVAELHRKNAARMRNWPSDLSATSTHDTKRSEDVRARINVLSEIPAEWLAAVSRWQGLNARLKSDALGTLTPDANEEYLLYQTLVGAWPLDGGVSAARDITERIQRYMEKACREAKVHTSWISPNVEFDQALASFVARALDPGESGPFLADLTGFIARVQRAGLLGSVSQTLLKIASPGVPDFYQGCELHQLSLVDPDNRRPVDFEPRRALLAELRRDAEQDLVGLVTRIARTPADGRLKLHVIHRALSLRRRRRELFEGGDYLPLTPRGERADHVVAFARTLGDAAVIALTGRFYQKLGAHADTPPGDAFRGTTLALDPQLPGGRFCDALTGETVEARGGALALDQVFRRLPVALLERQS